MKDIFKLVGCFVVGKKKKAGCYKFSNGDIFKGSFKKSKPNGNGTYTYANGDTFEGTVVDGARNGFGVQLFAVNLFFTFYLKRNFFL